MAVLIEHILSLLLAGFIGGIVGLEREYKQREAGLRTYALVCFSSALFVIISLELKKFNIYYDFGRIIANIVLGVGFLGSGLIIFRKNHIEGLTTAAGMWAVSAIGVAIALKFYYLAIFSASIVIAILSILRIIEQKMFNKK